jgi:fructose-bisphosphate aldolase class 1
MNRLHIPSTAETRRAYREMLFTTPDLARFVSGVIMYDETIRQVTQRGDAVPGIVFLSGEQDERSATAHLNAMNSGPESRPWRVSFSYGRALQDPALEAWGGRAAGVQAGQQALHHRARCNSAASLGEYDDSMERDTADVAMASQRAHWSDD